MGTFEECAVCGGETVERKVEKVLRCGNRVKSVKIQAKVCLRCGERFYGPKVIKRFAEIRAKLKASDAPNTPWINLQDKLDYEIWLLGFLEKHRPKNDAVSRTLKIDSAQNCQQLEEDYESSFAHCYTVPLLNAMMPLTFVAFFKTLDMLFEWIIEGNGLSSPRQFVDKVELLKKEHQLPPLFEDRPYLYGYAKALFCQLLPYRNAVVHENSFSVSEDTLTLSSSRTKTSLTLSSTQVGCLTRLVYVTVRALTGKVVIDNYQDKMLRYYLDILAPVHGLKIFGQQPPRFVHVKLTVPKQGPAFLVDLKNVRDQLARTFPSQETIFDLKVKGVEGEQLIAKWHFSPEEVPAFDVMTLYAESHAANREELVLP